LSDLRQGILRAVRLLPDVVKVGVGAETALPSLLEEGQFSNEEFSFETMKNDVPKENAPDPLQELSVRVAELQSDLAASEAVKKQLASRLSSLESELAKTKEDAARRERELTLSVEAAGERARAEGKTKGHAEGLESGRQASLVLARSEVKEEYKEKFSALVSLLEEMGSKLEENFAGLIALNQPRMVRLWQEMLKKMLRRETTLAPDAVLDVLADVLARLSDKNHLVIYVCPDDLVLLEERLREEFEDALRGVRRLELKSDTNVDKGSCIVETNLGIYDARWRTQLDQVEMVIEDLFQKLGKTPKPFLPHPRRKGPAVSENAENSPAGNDEND
jgi:flagellar assembly protein FliH